MMGYDHAAVAVSGLEVSMADEALWISDAFHLLVPKNDSNFSSYKEKYSSIWCRVKNMVTLIMVTPQTRF